MALILVSGLILLAIYLWLKYKYLYWRFHGLPYIEPTPFLGNLKELLLLKVSFGEFFNQLYNSYAGTGAPLVGIYILQRPALLVRDPELINLVLIKNFHMFLNRFEAADPCGDTMGSMALPLAKYPIWRESRKCIATFFTSGLIKRNMYPQMLKIAVELELHIQRRFGDHIGCRQTIEVKEMSSLFTIDITALLVYGIEANCLRDAKAPFKIQSQSALEPSIIKALHFFAIFFLPHSTGLIGAKVFSKSYELFIRETVNKIKRNRDQTRSIVKHLMSLLLDFTDDIPNTKHFATGPDFVLSQAAIFLLAGFETSSATIAFALYELAKQPLLQQRLRLEIRGAFDTENRCTIPYANLIELKYLNMVVSESLRLYPVAAFINRECTPPIGARAFSLKPFSNFEIPAGMPVYISILGIHRDPKYWPTPNHFDPERFSADNLRFHHPMTYIPFGSGPHGCIGSRLGLLQVKLGLVHILKDYTVELCSKTVREIKFDPKSFMLQAKGGIYLSFVKNS